MLKLSDTVAAPFAAQDALDQFWAVASSQAAQASHQLSQRELEELFGCATVAETVGGHNFSKNLPQFSLTRFTSAESDTNLSIATTSTGPSADLFESPPLTPSPTVVDSSSADQQNSGKHTPHTGYFGVPMLHASKIGTAGHQIQGTTAHPISDAGTHESASKSKTGVSSIFSIQNLASSSLQDHLANPNATTSPSHSHGTSSPCAPVANHHHSLQHDQHQHIHHRASAETNNTTSALANQALEFALRSIYGNSGSNPGHTALAAQLPKFGTHQHQQHVDTGDNEAGAGNSSANILNSQLHYYQQQHGVAPASINTALTNVLRSIAGNAANHSISATPSTLGGGVFGAAVSGQDISMTLNRSPAVVCQNCGTDTTTMWRRSKNGENLCNVCYCSHGVCVYVCVCV